MNLSREETEMDLDMDLDLDLDLDKSWLTDAETCLTDYASFYKTDTTRLVVVRVYIGRDGSIARVSRDDVTTLDKPNLLTVRHLCELTEQGVRIASPLTVRIWKKYLCTMTIDEDDVDKFVGDVNDTDDTVPGFFRDITGTVQDITIERTIEHFHDVNTLYMLFKEKEKVVHNTPIVLLTRKNRPPTNNLIGNSHQGKTTRRKY